MLMISTTVKVNPHQAIAVQIGLIIILIFQVFIFLVSGIFLITGNNIIRLSSRNWISNRHKRIRFMTQICQLIGTTICFSMNMSNVALHSVLRDILDNSLVRVDLPWLNHMNHSQRIHFKYGHSEYSFIFLAGLIPCFRPHSFAQMELHTPIFEWKHDKTLPNESRIIPLQAIFAVEALYDPSTFTLKKRRGPSNGHLYFMLYDMLQKPKGKSRLLSKDQFSSV